MPGKDAQSPNVTYRVVYYRDGKQTRNVTCDHVKMTDGLVRFVDSDGVDVWAIDADRVEEYEAE